MTTEIRAVLEYTDSKIPRSKLLATSNIWSRVSRKIRGPRLSEWKNFHLRCVNLLLFHVHYKFAKLGKEFRFVPPLAYNASISRNMKYSRIGTLPGIEPPEQMGWGRRRIVFRQ